MSVVDLPEKSTVVSTVSSDLSIRPTTNDHFVGIDGAKRVETASSWCILVSLGHTASCDRIRI